MDARWVGGSEGVANPPVRDEHVSRYRDAAALVHVFEIVDRTAESDISGHCVVRDRLALPLTRALGTSAAARRGPITDVVRARNYSNTAFAPSKRTERSPVELQTAPVRQWGSVANCRGERHSEAHWRPSCHRSLLCPAECGRRVVDAARLWYGRAPQPQLAAGGRAVVDSCRGPSLVVPLTNSSVLLAKPPTPNRCV